MGPKSEVMKFPSGREGSPELNQISYPRLGSIKYDGSFCLVYDGDLYSRRLILHQNRYLWSRFKPLLDYAMHRDVVFMGELFSCKHFHEGQSIFRSYTADLHDTAIMVFDCMSKADFDLKTGSVPFEHRYLMYKHMLKVLDHEYTIPIQQNSLSDEQAAQTFFQRALSSGHEGIVTRDPGGYYKHGRCTFKEGNLFRHRKYERADAVVLDIHEQSRRKTGVEVPKLADGTAYRSFKKDDYEPAGMAGSMEVRDEGGRIFKAGLGEYWTFEARRRLWRERGSCKGKTVEIEYNPTGEKNNPRQPKVVRFRDDK